MIDAIKIKKDLLAGMLAKRQISYAEYLAGREWQQLLEDVELQGGSVIAFDASYRVQRLYQQNGILSDRQADAYDTRAAMKRRLGAEAFADLDRLLSAPSSARVKLGARGVAYLQSLLLRVSVLLDLQGVGIDPWRGAEQPAA